MIIFSTWNSGAYYLFAVLLIVFQYLGLRKSAKITGNSNASSNKKVFFGLLVVVQDYVEFGEYDTIKKRWTICSYPKT